MRLVRAGLVTMIALVPWASAASAANLIHNAGFDDNVDGWEASLGSIVVHSGADAQGSPVSGSMLLGSDGPEPDTISASQCLPVVVGKTYAFGARARIPLGQKVASAQTLVRWYDSAGCFGSPLGNVFSFPNNVNLQGAWGTAQGWATVPANITHARLFLRAGRVPQTVVPIQAEFDDAFLLEDLRCAPTPTTLCLNQGRFRVVAEWRTKAGLEGYGQATPLTDDSGYFWFFNDANVELVTKLLDACATQFDRFWFFAAGLTDVQTTIRVHDTVADVERVYQNPQETPFAPIQDTDAFATCP